MNSSSPRRVISGSFSSALRTGRGPLLRSRAAVDRAGTDQLHRAWHAGRLVRLARGVYCPAETWQGLAPWDRFTLAAAAVATVSPQTVFTGATAAHLHGLPLLDVPGEVQDRSPWPGHRGRRAPVAQAVSARAAPDLIQPPLRSSAFRVVLAPGAVPVQLELHLSDGSFLGTARVEALPSVHLQLASALPLRQSIVPLDRLARTHATASALWVQEHSELPSTEAARARFARACAFADARSESPGESFSRVVIEELGFAPPVLQRRVVGPDGREEGRVDFWWSEVGVGGEFDGITKYDVGLYTSEAERRRAIRAEKNREVRLLRILRGLARWTWEDLRQPARLESELLRHGVPWRRG